MRDLNLGAFLGSRESAASGLASADSRLGSFPWTYLRDTPTRLHRNPMTGLPIFLRHSIAQSHKYENINSFPIGYASQPRLRDRLTLGRLPSPRKPRVYGERVFHPFYRYSCQHNHFPPVHGPSRTRFSQMGTLPYQLPCGKSEASAACLAPLHFRRSVIRPVSYYAFFKRWLLLSQRPGCLHNATTLTTEHAF